MASDDIEALRAENKALRTALIQVCTDACTGADDRRRTWAIREAANHLSEPFSWEKAQRVYDEVTYHRLESDDREALRYAVERIGLPWGNPTTPEMHLRNRSLAVLDKLIGGAK